LRQVERILGGLSAGVGVAIPQRLARDSKQGFEVARWARRCAGHHRFIPKRAHRKPALTRLACSSLQQRAKHRRDDPRANAIHWLGDSLGNQRRSDFRPDREVNHLPGATQLPFQWNWDRACSFASAVSAAYAYELSLIKCIYFEWPILVTYLGSAVPRHHDVNPGALNGPPRHGVCPISHCSAAR